MRSSSAIIFGAVTILFGWQAARADIMPIGEASTASFIQGLVGGPTARGWDFLVNTPNVSVTQMGVSAATSGTITLTLWDDTTQTELAQVVGNAVANTWMFTSLGSAVPLAEGHTYNVTGWEDTPDASPWYLLNATPPAAFNPAGAIQYLDTRFGNDVDSNTFPSETLPSPSSYGVVDIAYTTSTSVVPEPAYTLLLAIAGAGLMLRRRIRI